MARKDVPVPSSTRSLAEHEQHDQPNSTTRQSPATFFFHVVTDNTNKEHDPTIRLRALAIHGEWILRPKLP
jgi:hypothetical protein